MAIFRIRFIFPSPSSNGVDAASSDCMVRQWASLGMPWGVVNSTFLSHFSVSVMSSRAVCVPKWRKWNFSGRSRAQKQRNAGVRERNSRGQRPQMTQQHSSRAAMGDFRSSRMERGVAEVTTQCRHVGDNGPLVARLAVRPLPDQDGNFGFLFPRVTVAMS